MKKNSMVSVLFATLLTLSQAQAAVSSSPEATKNYGGKVGLLIVNAMKSSGIKSACDKDGSCKYIITDFSAADETDGCGGGTTSYDTSYTNVDKSKFEYHECEGEDNRRMPPNRASELVSIITDLDYFKTSGWTSYVNLSKITCTTYKAYPNAGYCEVIQGPDAE